jgi:hypothetical protein
MKTRWILITLGLVVLLGLVAGSVPIAQSFQYNNSPPTEAPAPIPEQAVLEKEPWPTSVPYKYIKTAKEAAAMAQYHDSYFAKWESESWSPSLLDKDQSRLIVKEFASRTEESADAGRFEIYTEDTEADAGGVWRVTIIGRVKVALIGSGFDPDAVYDRVTYVIAKRTGNLLATISGEYAKPR